LPAFARSRWRLCINASRRGCARRFRRHRRGEPLLERFLGAVVDAPPTQIFDQLYYLGSKSVATWAIVTSAGIIQIDSLNNTADAKRVIVEGYQKLGLDPGQMKYLVLTHGHNDHFGGAKYLQDTYHPRVLMSATDWDMVAKLPPATAQGVVAMRAASARQPRVAAERRLAERVGFEPLLVVENKELTGSPLPHDPLETLKDPARRTYCPRDAIYDSYMA